ncbi:hypothetical protein EYF80_028388 [Liparis tanakae]|uniref:Uncharacterized protein n=1 Tax=Liparis tanakae TaxID=230148 RepID=A0A4Z2H6Y1_9TELE|nr:hypothetical protein EYF80_028388 [Liparis tanakae]
MEAGCTSSLLLLQAEGYGVSPTARFPDRRRGTMNRRSAPSPAPLNRLPVLVVLFHKHPRKHEVEKSSAPLEVSFHAPPSTRDPYVTPCDQNVQKPRIHLQFNDPIVFGRCSVKCEIGVHPS